MFLASLNEAQKEALICLAHNVVVCDGELASDEKEMMDEMRKEMSLPQNLEARYLPIEGIDEIFDTRRSRTIALISLLRLGYADGSLEMEERFLLEDLCRAFDIDAETFSRLQQWVLRLVSLERDARVLLD